MMNNSQDPVNPDIQRILGLDDRQAVAAELLASGVEQGEIAERVAVSEETLICWIRFSFGFQARYELIRHLRHQQVDNLRSECVLDLLEAASHAAPNHIGKITIPSIGSGKQQPMPPTAEDLFDAQVDHRYRVAMRDHSDLARVEDQLDNQQFPSRERIRLDVARTHSDALAATDRDDQR